MFLIEKVVERAQQKLKLDAMIVQQGRLTDNAKKVGWGGVGWVGGGTRVERGRGLWDW